MHRPSKNTALLQESRRENFKAGENSMSKEIFWLVLTLAMTGLFWVPYILDRIMVRGLAGAIGNPSPSDKAQSAWAQRMMAAKQRGGKSCHLRAAGFGDTSTRHCDRDHRFWLCAVLLVAAGSCRGLHARHSRAANDLFRRRVCGRGIVGAGDLQTDLKSPRHTIFARPPPGQSPGGRPCSDCTRFTETARLARGPASPGSRA